MAATRRTRNGATGEALSLLSPDEGGLLRQIQRILKDDIEMVTVDGFAPTRPVRMGSDAPGARGANPRGPGGGNGPRRLAHRPHGQPAPRHAHAGPQRRGGAPGGGRSSGSGTGAGSGSGSRNGFSGS